MNVSKLSDISARLGELYASRAEARIMDWQNRKDLEARQVALTPTGDDYKALGSNDGQRKAALEAIFAADDQLAIVNEALPHIQSDLEIVQAEIDALTDERRAIEWQVRARLVDALETAGVQQNGRGDRAEFSFDDAVMDTLDAEADRRGSLVSTPAGITDEFPF